MNVYVSSFTGWMMTYTAKSKAKMLASTLDTVSAKYKSDYFYAAGYNRYLSRREFVRRRSRVVTIFYALRLNNVSLARSPMTWFNRHNEVWFEAQEEPVCPDNQDMS